MNVRVAEFLWPYMSAIVPRLVNHPATCLQSFELIQFLIFKLLPKLSPVLDLPRLAEQCADLLLGLNSTEVRTSSFAQPVRGRHADSLSALGCRGF